DVFRIFDALNDERNLKVPIEAVKAEGGHAQGCVSYTISPVHTIDFFVDLFKRLERMGCDSIAVKDMSGILTPLAAEHLVTGSKDGGLKIPIDIHTHCTSGMAMLTYMKAIEAGAEIVDTCISPFSGGTAQPPTESLVAALRGTEHDTGYDPKLLMEIREHFLDVWYKYQHLHNIDNLLTDPSVTVHQIPGGMLSNFRSQLQQQKAIHKFPELLKEIPLVRKELGYPPLVTPTSQIVGTQAFLNVMFGRYKNVSQQTKDYAKGMYGKPPGKIAPEIYEKVLGPNWKDEIVQVRPADLLEPRMKTAKEELEKLGLIKKPEDVLTYVMYPQVGLTFLKGEAKAEFTGDQLPLLKSTPSDSVIKKVEYPSSYRVKVDGSEYSVNMHSPEVLEVNGKKYSVAIATGGAPGSSPSTKPSGPAMEVKSPLLGTILKVKVQPGQRVKEGDVLAVLEAMKMENDIQSPRAGLVRSVNVKEGQNVEEGAVIAVLE
ncbi:MAG: pyruvate carboxylase subunit B, partial [Candidatus Thermoplasmatota archaeon]|nr:pyruvate carboxylase subunit B [Candidatus Thermoplasmatota archaeon]